MKSGIALTISVLLGIAASATISGCDSAEEVAELPVRPIKSMVVKSRPSLQLRKLSGIVSAETSTALSFELSGNISRLSIKVGDLMQEGDVIAELDPEPYQLKLKTSQSELFSAQASLKNAQEKFKQQSALRTKGFTTKTNYDTAVANLKNAEGSLQVAQTRLNIAERDLKKTKLIAPFRGRISEKTMEIFNEVQPGQKIVELITDSQLNIDVSVPEGFVDRIKLGDAVDLNFPTMPNLKTSGKIYEIGSSAGAVNAFPVTITLDQQFPELKPGVSAEVTFKLRSNIKGDIFLLPLTAILPTPGEKARAFVFDPAEKLLRERRLEVVNVLDNMLEVKGDLKDGEIIAVAGISFLHDGMKARLMSSAENMQSKPDLRSAQTQ